MSVTIDTLQLEIQSNSSNAAQGIDNLSAALVKLKQTGSIGVAVKNLRNLSDALKGFTTSGSTASNIGSLANSLRSLKEVGSLTRVANGISKLDKVVDSLDDTQISAFADKMTRLSDALTPLAAKLTTIRSGLRSISTAARSAGSGVKSMSNGLNTASVNMSSFLYISQSVVSVLTRIAQKLADFISQAIEWDGVAARFGRTFGPQASETYEWIKKLNEEMGINIQTFMQYSSVYASMLSGFGVAQEDAAKMAVGYTELTYDIWAGYNDIYKTYAEAADAVRSAIAGEVEPIRRAGFTIVDSQLAITAANYGLAYSTQTATEADKSYLRYLTLVNQAYSQNLVGTYAREMNTAEGVMRTFSQQLKSLAQAFGSLFLPVLVKVMPYVQAFVELLTEAVHWIASLFGFEIQAVDWSGYNSGIGGITDSAGEASDAVDGVGDAVGDTTKKLKELKNATIGIDELNVISPPDPSSGSGGSGGGAGWGNTGDGILGDLGADSLWDESIFNGIKDKVDEIKEKFKEWLPVIEGIGATLGALSLLKFIEDIGEAMSQMSLLRKVLASVLTVVIEAALVFTFADNYLETGNLLYLLGEALVTAGAGYLLFKAWGDKGAVLGMAVSIAAQLAAITLNVADGTVDVGDPELWIQTAMTTLTGAAGGYFAFRGVGAVGGVKGAILGATITLSLSLAAITIGGVAADGFDLTDALTGALSTALGGAAGAGLFSLLGIATGGTGFLIGAGIMLAVNVIGAIVASVAKDAEEDMEKDLKSRFGDIELTLDEIQVVVAKLQPKWADEVILAVDLREQVEALAESVDEQLAAIGTYEWKISVGIGLTEDEEESYKASIDSFIATCQQYVTERGHALEVGLKATTSNQSIIDSANAVSVAANTELERLGKQLQETVNDAYEDGLLDIDELEAIQNIRNDMMEIQNALAESEIEAEFSMLEMKWSGVELTPESFENMMTEWKTTLDEKVKPALESTVKENLKTLEGNVAFAKMQLEKNPGDTEAKQLLEDAEKALQDYLNENPLEGLTADASFKAVKFALNTLQEAYQAELEQARQEGWFDYDLQLDEVLTINAGFKFDDGDGEIYGNIEAMADQIRGYMELETSELSDAARTSLEKMIEAMKPTMEDYEEIAEANRKAGETVTENIRNGLNDYNELAALSGDVDAINYMVGKGFSEDPTFINTLLTAENAGKQVTGKVREGLLNNIDYVYDDATGLMLGIKDCVTGETITMTPILEANLRDMGVNMGDALGGEYDYVYDETTGMLKAIVDSTTGNEVWINKELNAAGKGAGKDLSDGLGEGIEDKESSLWDKIKGWGAGILDQMRTKFEIHSPSKATKRMGKNLSDGLSLGMGINAISSKLSEMWGKAETWWNNSKGTLATYTPSIGSIRDKLSSAWSTAKTWWSRSKGTLSTYTPDIGSIKSKLSSAWSTAKTWWNRSKGTMSYTPTIGSIKSKLSSAWSSAKTWWNRSKGSMSYTPSIGSIKSKLQSAWSTAKKWWNSNVKLSIPSLSFKVTYSSVSGWKKAIVKALDLPGWPKLSFAANGGIFDQGSMIWAGERGPEIVANAAGGKTGVMNVQQMSDAVYEGVYAAVTAAMRSNGGSNGSQSVNVYLDGKQITAAVEQRQRERGATIMGSQVYSY